MPKFDKNPSPVMKYQEKGSSFPFKSPMKEKKTKKKDKLNEWDSSGMSILELHQKLEVQAEDCVWSDASLDIQMPKPKLRIKIF